MQEHHFRIPAPFASVAEVLEDIDGLVVEERSEIHCLCILAGRAGVIIRPAYPDTVDVIVAEPDGTTVAHELAERFESVLGIDLPAPAPFQTA